jgi:predicted RND superfamily exporter protein
VATLALLFLVVLLELGRPARALAIVASVGAGLVLTGGAMALFGLDLDFMNAAVLPMILGVSVDNAIHLDRRLAEVGPDGFGLAWRQTGAAAVASSLTNLAGFASLLVARGGGLVSVGRVSVIGIVATLVTTTLAYPIVRLALARARVLRTSRP